MIANILPDRELWWKIRTVIFPISLQHLLLNLDATIDSIMLGHVGQDALASVSLAGQVQFVYNMLMGAIISAFSIFISQYFGKKDMRTVEKLLGMLLQINFIVALFFFFVTLFFSNQVMGLFTDEQVFIELGGSYLRYLTVSYFFLAVNMAFSAVCRCTGFAKKIMLISSLTVPLDIIFNYFFIFGIGKFHGMGVPGAAIATVLVRAVTMILVFLEFRRENQFRFKPFYLIHSSRELWQKIVHYTMPILGNYGCFGAGVISGAVIMGHQEPDTVAANALARMIMGTASVFYCGFSSGTSIILGNLLGAGDLEKARKSGCRLMFFALFAGFIAAIFMLATIPFVNLFAKLTLHAAELSRWMILLLVPVVISKAVNAVQFYVFNTGGDSKFSFQVDLLVSIMIMIPLGFLAAFVLHWPLLLVFVCVNIDEPLKCPLALIHFLKYTWLKNLTLREKDLKLPPETNKGHNSQSSFCSQRIKS